MSFLCVKKNLEFRAHTYSVRPSISKTVMSDQGEILQAGAKLTEILMKFNIITGEQ